MPASTSALIASTSFCIDGLSWPLPMMSKHCTIGMPACSIVASWRANSAMSSDVIFLPLLKSCISLRTLLASTPWRRRSAFTAASDTASILPLMRLPFLSVPSQTNGNC